MAALSDYLESALLNHLFRGSSFPKPSSIAIALTSGVPLDSDTGSSLPEIPSGVTKGVSFVTTNYKRLALGNPATSGDTIWNAVGVDSVTAFSVSGTSISGVTSGLNGYYHPLYLSSGTAIANDNLGQTDAYRFRQFPNVVFYSAKNIFQSGVAQNPGYTLYEGNGFIKNSSQLVFDTALQDWGWISGIAVVDSSIYGSGNVLMYAQLSNPRYVYTGDNIKFDLNSLEISLQ